MVEYHHEGTRKVEKRIRGCLRALKNMQKKETTHDRMLSFLRTKKAVGMD